MLFTTFITAALVSSYQEPGKYSISSLDIWSPVVYIVIATVFRVPVQRVSRSGDRSRPLLTTLPMEQQVGHWVLQLELGCGFESFGGGGGGEGGSCL